MKYPRVLIISSTRVNAVDAENNGLLLRNLFGNWPPENLAQIYSSGDNGDFGFFRNYYQLGPKDRCMGSMFYKLKAEEQSMTVQCDAGHLYRPDKKTKKFTIKSIGRQLIVDTGLYEVIFQPRLSQQMKTPRILCWCCNKHLFNDSACLYGRFPLVRHYDYHWIGHVLKISIKINCT